MQDSHGVSTPIASGIKLEKPSQVASGIEQKELDRIPYEQVVGSLIFLACLTRPDLSYAVHLVSQFMSDYRHEHWVQVKRILRYIKQTQRYRIRYNRGKGDLELIGFSDNDWGADLVSRKSLGAYVFLLAGAPCSWTCKRNQSICLSSSEAEYKALTSAAKEAIWERRCLADIGQEQSKPTTLYCDNQGAISLSNNPVFHSRTKHIAIHHHFIRDVVASKEIRLEYIHTQLNAANMLTKPLLTELQQRHCEKLGLIPERDNKNHRCESR